MRQIMASWCPGHSLFLGGEGGGVRVSFRRGGGSKHTADNMLMAHVCRGGGGEVGGFDKHTPDNVAHTCISSSRIILRLGACTRNIMVRSCHGRLIRSCACGSRSCSCRPHLGAPLTSLLVSVLLWGVDTLFAAHMLRSPHVHRECEAPSTYRIVWICSGRHLCRQHDQVLVEVGFVKNSRPACGALASLLKRHAASSGWRFLNVFKPPRRPCVSSCHAIHLKYASNFL